MIINTFFGVVKADCYGHNDISTVKTIIDVGCNYLAVATLEEALFIRKEIRDIPIVHVGASEATEFYPKRIYIK